MKNKRLTLIIVLLIFTFCSTAQPIHRSFVKGDIFQTAFFVENKGQFDKIARKGQPIRYAVENDRDLIYFNAKGCIWKLNKSVPVKSNKSDGKGEEEGEEDEEADIVEKLIFMEWLHANPDCRIESERKSGHYFTYGEKKYNSYGYEKIIYKNLYPHIDAEYIIPKQGGIKYSLILHPGADVRDVKLAYKGSHVGVKQMGDSLTIHNDVCNLTETGLNAFYQDGSAINCHYQMNGNEIEFRFSEPVDITRDIVIDPWVTQITSLTSTNMNTNNKGYDVDYDYQGHLYVYGAGGTNAKVAKYSSTGTLIWTFSGTIVSPAWVSSGSIGNFSVDKLSSKAYIGQGFVTNGSRVVRLDTNGVYDNFISTAVTAFREIWEMNFDCNTGSILLMGGSTNSNNSVALMDPAGILTLNSVSGIATFNQDILSSAVAENGDVFVEMASIASTTLNNRMLKLNSTINGNSWIASTGYSAFTEAGNKPYANGSNGFNALHANINYLYYYDGRHIKAFDKATGLPVGNADSIVAYSVKLQGGIYADNCDNVYVGGRDGNLHVYHFDGSVFTALPDIVLTGTPGMNIHDIRYNNSDGLLYVTGDSLVATVPRSQPCVDTASLNVTFLVDCDHAIVQLVNADSTALYSYIWTDSNANTIVQSHMNMAHLSDTLNILASGHVYHVLITKSDFCGSAVGAINFTAAGNTYLSANPVICNGQTITVNGHTYSSTGSYSDTLINGAGCDTIITTNLLVLPSDTTMQSVNVCYGQTATINGNVYSNTGVYTDTFVNATGCDSILITNLLVMPIDSTTQTVNICNGQSFTVNGNVYNSSGLYTDTTINITGCDSIIHTQLIVSPLLTSSQNMSVCYGQSFTINGHVYNSSGVYSDTLSTVAGCDSVVETNLLVMAPDTTSQFVTLCNGQSTIVNGHTYNVTGLYHDTLSNLFGCDSILMTHVLVLPPVTSTENVIICAGQSATINGQTYTMAGVYTDTLTNASGCDTIQTIILSITPPLLASQHLNICGGKSITVNGHTYQVAGTYIDSLVNAAGCDSLLTTVLEVDNSYEEPLYIPNAFTPNGDGNNDCFRILGQSEFNEFYMAIYNRWGQRVFESNNILDCWEGDFKTRQATEGVYYFFFRGKTDCGDVFRKGDLILMR